MIGFTYNELEAMAAEWVEETGASEYEDAFPLFVRLAEMRLVKDLNLEIFDVTDTTPTVVSGSRSVAKPTGCISTRSLWLITAGVRAPLLQRTRDWCTNYSPDPALTGIPKYYFERDEDTWQLVPTPAVSGTLEVVMVKRPLGLTPANQNTWLGDNCGDLLFSCILMESEHWTKADDRYDDMQKKYYGELLPTGRMEIRNLVRKGDYAPFAAAAEKAK